MKKFVLAVCVAVACSPAVAKKNIVFDGPDKINVIADPKGQGNGVRDNPHACLVSALACAPVLPPPLPPVVQPPVTPPVVVPPVIPPVVVPPVVQPPVTPPAVVPPTTPPAVVPPTPVTPVTPITPTPGYKVVEQRAVPCVKDWAQCKFGELSEHRAVGSVIDEVIFYEIK